MVWMQKMDFHAPCTPCTWTVHVQGQNPLKMCSCKLWKWYCMHIFNQNEFMKFLPKIFMNEPMPCKWDFMPYDSMLGKYMLQGSMCKKNHSNWPFGLKVMLIWSLNHTLPWLNHISSTTHEKSMILDVLEMGEKDLQLSCWTKFHLKISWWCNLELKLV